MGTVQRSLGGKQSASKTAIQAKAQELLLISADLWCIPPAPLNFHQLKELSAHHLEQANLWRSSEHFQAWVNLIRVQSVYAAILAKENLL